MADRRDLRRISNLLQYTIDARVDRNNTQHARRRRSMRRQPCRHAAAYAHYQCHTRQAQHHPIPGSSPSNTGDSSHAPMARPLSIAVALRGISSSARKTPRPHEETTVTGRSPGFRVITSRPPSRSPIAGPVAYGARARRLQLRGQPRCAALAPVPGSLFIPSPGTCYI
jgi:hypothetical protein